jgi:hypothetical protein
MSRFEFLMGFYGLILGLALTRLMAEFADLLRSRDRGSLGLLVPAGVALLFVQIMATFFDAYIKLQQTSPNFAGLALPTLIGTLYFAAAVVVVPREQPDRMALDDYFYRQRKWIIGWVIAANIGTLGIELPMVAGFIQAGQWYRTAFYVAINLILFGALFVALLARRRGAVFGAMLFNLLFVIYLYSPIAFNPFTDK